MADNNLDYNLTDNVKKSFNFKLGDLIFNFRYPTTREMRELSALNNDLQELAKNKASDKKIKEASDKSEAKMNDLVTPVDHATTISEVLEDMPINVVRNFRNMMNKELNLS